MRLTALAIVACACAPALATAQPRSPVARVDVAATIGSFNGNHDDLSEYDNWAQSLFRSITAGYYWTDHLKTEAEIGWAGTGDIYSSGPIVASGVPPGTWVFSEHEFRDTIGSIAQTYQFGRNAMFHPFVTAGVDVVRETESVERIVQRVAVPGGTVVVSPEESSSVAVRGQPFLATGFKAYLSERAFFRTVLKLGIRDQIDQVVWSAGFGFDF